MIDFWLHMKSVPKGRPRAARAGHMYTPKRTRDFEAAVAEAVREQLPEDFSIITNPVHMSYVFYVKVPKSWKAAKKAAALRQDIYPMVGDLDNRVKAVSDALNGLLFLDDRQIVQSTEAVLYHATVDSIYFTVTELGSNHEEDHGGGA